MPLYTPDVPLCAPDVPLGQKHAIAQDLERGAGTKLSQGAAHLFPVVGCAPDVSTSDRPCRYDSPSILLKSYSVCKL